MSSSKLTPEDVLSQTAPEDEHLLECLHPILQSHHQECLHFLLHTVKEPTSNSDHIKLRLERIAQTARQLTGQETDGYFILLCYTLVVSLCSITN